MKENLNDLRAFLMVAQTGSFTKAGAQMGVSQSALSHAIRAIEERFIHDYPEVELELGNDTRFVDIVAERFDGAIICIILIGDIIRLCCTRWWCI